MAISSSTTPFSRASSSGSSVLCSTRSDRISTHSGMSSSIALTWKQVHSLAVNAFRFAPIASISIEMSIALLRSVPLNSMCSQKCDTPELVSFSKIEPALTQTPSEIDRKCGIGSNTTVIPLDNFRKVMSSPFSCGTVPYPVSVTEIRPKCNPFPCIFLPLSKQNREQTENPRVLA